MFKRKGRYYLFQFKVYFIERDGLYIWIFLETRNFYTVCYDCIYMITTILVVLHGTFFTVDTIFIS